MSPKLILQHCCKNTGAKPQVQDKHRCNMVARSLHEDERREERGGGGNCYIPSQTATYPATFCLALATQHKTQPSPQLVCLVLATLLTLSSDIQPPDKLSCLVFATTDTIPMLAGTRTITPDTINGNGLFILNAKEGGILPQRGGEVPKGGDTPTTPLYYTYYTPAPPLLHPYATPTTPLLNPCNALTPCILTCMLSHHARCFDKYLQPCSDWLRLCGLSERNGGRYYL